MKKISRKPILIIVASSLIVFGLCIGYFTNKADAPIFQPSNITNSNATKVPETEPNASPVGNPYNDKNLDECLARASNSEAQAYIVEGAMQACRRKFGQE